MKGEFLLKIYYAEQGEEIENVILNLLLKKIDKNNVSWVFEFVIKYYIIFITNSNCFYQAWEGG